MATHLSFMVSNAVGPKVLVSTVFKCKTIEALSHYILNEAKGGKSEILRNMQRADQSI